MGAEDFAYYLEKVPGAFIWLGVGEDVSGLHTPSSPSTRRSCHEGRRCSRRSRWSRSRQGVAPVCRRSLGPV